MPARKIVVAGGTGFIGCHLVARLAERGDDVVVLLRGGESPAGSRGVAWDGATVGTWGQEVEGAYAVVNLAGESIQQRWTEEAKRRILDSRLRSVGALCQAIRQAGDKPARWINASAVGYYGDRGNGPLDESAGPGTGFLAETCVAWETAVHACDIPTARTCVRFGMVLGDGGALPVLKKLARWGLGGPAGTGEQIVSWIHVEDLVSILIWAIDRASTSATLNGVAPETVSNRELMREIRKSVGAPVGLPAPAFGVRLVGNLIGPDADLVLSGANVKPAAALGGGFEFRYPKLSEALAAIR